MHACSGTGIERLQQAACLEKCLVSSSCRILDKQAAPATRDPAPLSSQEARLAAAAARAEAAADSDGHLVSANPVPTTVSNADGTALVAARTIGVQTKFRDGEAQTDAFTAAYTIKAGHNPEVLSIAHVRMRGPPGAALPAGPGEVAMIQRLRERRELEASLPPMTDEAGFSVRKRLMQAQELSDWKFREAEMDSANEGKVQAVAEALEERETRREFQSDARVEALREQLEREKEEVAASIQKKRLQTLRKLARDREAAERKADAVAGTGVTSVTRSAAAAQSAAATGLLSPGQPGGAAASLARAGSSSASGRAAKKSRKRGGRDIIADYADPGSTVFAPRRRDGAQADRLSAAARFDSAGVAPVRGAMALNALDETLPPSALTAKITRPDAALGSGSRQKRSQGTSISQAKAERALAADLERVHELLHTAKAGDRGPKAAALTGLTGMAVDEGAAGAGSVSSSAVYGRLGRSRVDQSKVPVWRKAKVVAARPTTPSFEAEDETPAEAELEQAVLLLQRLLRGRREQNELSEGKERRMALIGEIRRDLLRAAERRAVADEEEAAEAARRLRREEDATMDAMAGMVGSATADFLAKELIRTEQKRRVAQLVSGAKEERRRKEAVEAGRRQAEESIRAKRDMVWRQLVRVHEAGAASLVTETIDEVLSQVAGGIAEAVVVGLPAERAADDDAPVDASSSAIAVEVAAAAAKVAEQAHVEGAKAGDEEAFEEAAKAAMQDAGISPRADDASSEAPAPQPTGEQ